MDPIFVLIALGKYQNLALQKIFSYLVEIHGEDILNDLNIRQFWRENFLKVSAMNKKNLQLQEVLKIVDKTHCPIGKRFLQEAINRPLADDKQVNDRLDGVEFLLENNSFMLSIPK